MDRYLVKPPQIHRLPFQHINQWSCRRWPTFTSRHASLQYLSISRMRLIDRTYFFKLNYRPLLTNSFTIPSTRLRPRIPNPTSPHNLLLPIPRHRPITYPQLRRSVNQNHLTNRWPQLRSQKNQRWSPHPIKINRWYWTGLKYQVKQILST